MTSAVEGIIKKVKRGGDKALIELTKKYDGAVLNKKTISVSKKEINEAVKTIPLSHKKLILRLKKRITLYHKKIRPRSLKFREKGITLGEIWQPIERVGIYVPAGFRPLVSSLLMTACPAQAAGVKEIVLVSPPSRKGLINPYILYIANILGIEKIYKIGGAQAIAALAFGTTTIPKVQKIAGPGNIYVTLAKKLLYGEVGIDLLAGPSEIVILADGTAPLDYIALDLFSQLEHGDGAVATLISTSQKLIKDAGKSLRGFKLDSVLRLDRGIKPWNDKKGNFKYVPSLTKGIELVNKIAPEHLEIMVKEPKKILPLIKNAGAIFVGPYSPVPLGDYAAGPSHVLPTSGTSCFSSGITTQTFMKRTSLISAEKKGFLRLSKDAQRLAEIEGLPAHKKALAIRKIYRRLKPAATKRGI